MKAYMDEHFLPTRQQPGSSIMNRPRWPIWISLSYQSVELAASILCESERRLAGGDQYKCGPCGCRVPERLITGTAIRKKNSWPGGSCRS
jgi:hypothetical protein